MIASIDQYVGIIFNADISLDVIKSSFIPFNIYLRYWSMFVELDRPYTRTTRGGVGDQFPRNLNWSVNLIHIIQLKKKL